MVTLGHKPNSPMTTYLFELPTTGAISFSEFCVDQGSRESYDMHIARCTEVRASLRGALKENKRTRDEKDYLSLVKALGIYLKLAIVSLFYRYWTSISRFYQVSLSLWPTTR